MFDFVFVDGDKCKYIDYYEMIFVYFFVGGYIIVDNILWDGYVFEELYSNDY